MAEPVEPLVIDLLEWIGREPRPYAEVIEAWRTSCPRLPVWEEANARGFVERQHEAGSEARVQVSAAGRAFLQSRRAAQGPRPRPPPSTPKALALSFRRATPEDVPACLVLRGLTRQNAIPVERLAAMGITEESWAADVRSDALPGFVCCDDDTLVGYCFGDKASGEVVVLALLPAYEDRGIGRRLLDRVVEHLAEAGHARLFLGCAADPATRSHGFYRHLGWTSTGTFDGAGDEILEFSPPPRAKA